MRQALLHLLGWVQVLCREQTCQILSNQLHNIHVSATIGLQLGLYSVSKLKDMMMTTVTKAMSTVAAVGRR